MVGPRVTGTGGMPLTSWASRLARRARRRSTASADPGLLDRPPLSSAIQVQPEAWNDAERSVATRVCNRSDVTICGITYGHLGTGLDVLAKPGPIDLLEGIGLKGSHDPANGFRIHRDVVRITVHETHRSAILPNLEHVSAQYDPLALSSTCPVQHRCSREMAAQPDQPEARRQLVGLTLPKDDRRMRSHEPFAVGGMEIYGHIAQRSAPLYDGGIVVWVRDRDGQNAAKRLDRRHAAVIYQSNAVPQDIPLRCPDMQCALANRKLGLSHQTDQLRCFDIQAIRVGPLEVLQGSPRESPGCRSRW